MDTLTDTDIKDLIFLCKKDLGIEEDFSGKEKNFQTVIMWLRKEIQHLLNTDLQKLLNILYRIDISEQETKEVLTSSNPSEMAADLTSLIVNREVQKVHTRKKYRER